MKIKNSYRFLSVFLIIALIVPSFVGIRASAAGTEIFDGFYYSEEKISDHYGKNVNVFVMTADISKSNLTIVAGIPNDETPLKKGVCQTVKNQAIAAQNNGVNVLGAVNADFFHMGDNSVIQPNSVTIKNGVKLSEYTTDTNYRAYFFGIKKDGTAVIGDKTLFNKIESELVEAVGGGPWLVKNGVTNYSCSYEGPHPRTVVGIKADGSVILLVADGRTSSSAGLSYGDIRDYMLSLGAKDVLNLDGGGSTTAVVKNPDTYSFEVKNHPSDGYERKVGNTLMIINTGKPALSTDKKGYYLIEKFEDLDQIQYDLSGKYRLVRDISAKNKKNISIPPFSGEFDGNGFSITDLHVNKADSYALFKDITQKGHVHDFSLKNVNITSNDSASALAINCEGTVERVYLSGKITGGNNSAGLISQLKDGGKVSLCKVEATVTGQDHAGGMIARISDGTLVNKCYVNATVSGVMRAGGLVAAAYTNGGSADIKNCIVSGKVTASDCEPGGIGGLLKVGVTNCIVKDMQVISLGKDPAETGNVAGLLGGWCNGNQQYKNNVIISGSITSDSTCSSHRISYHSDNKVKNYAYEYITINGSYADDTNVEQEGISATAEQLQSIDFYKKLGFDFSINFFWDENTKSPMLKCIDNDSHTNVINYDENGHWLKCTSCFRKQSVEDHTFGEYVYNNDATCIHDGTETATCTVCGCQTTRAANNTATGHDFKDVWSYKTQYHYHECKACGKVKDAGIHEFGEYIYNGDATENEDGTETATCTVCGFQSTRTAVGTATGEHIFGEYIYNNDATCAEDGTETAVCTICGTKSTRIAQGTATGQHIFGEYIYNYDATCVENGTETALCTVCGLPNTRIAEGTAPGHDCESKWLYDDDTHYHICKVCNDKTDIAKHTLSDYVYNRDATEQADGTETATCNVCGFQATRIVNGTRIIINDSSKLFTDVKSSAWYKSAIDYAATFGILKGYTDNTIKPNKAITRAEFVQILANIEGIDTTDKDVSTDFGDVSPGQWYTPAIKWAYENNLVDGVGGGCFSPNYILTREQMCKIIIDFVKYKKLVVVNIKDNAAFSDDETISEWAKDYVYACQMAGFVEGTNGAFNPKSTATRAQVATIIMRLNKAYKIIQGTY